MLNSLRQRLRVPTAVPSGRFCAYLGLGAVLWVVYALSPGFLPLVLTYHAGLLLVVVADLAVSPRPRQFELERHTEARLNLGAANTVVLRARSRARLAVDLTLRDEPPPTWEVESTAHRPMRDGVLLPQLPQAHVSLGPGESASGSYRLWPDRRGDFEFGRLHARLLSPLGLWVQQWSVALPHEQSRVRVYPNVTEVRRYELALRDGKLRDAGLHLLRLRGQGTEFESLREYTTDDEFKSINWKASARRGHLIATNYEIERDQTVMICLDCGRMMTSLAVSRASQAPGAARETGATREAGAANLLEAGTTPLSKLDCAINATVLLAHVAASMGDAVGLLLFSDSVLKFLPPRKGRVQTGAIIEALYAVQPVLVEPDYEAAYEYLMARKLRRSLVVTFTDIIDPEASRELLNASGAVRKRHNALCVTINNRDVLDLAASLPTNSTELYQKAMAQHMLDQRTAALERLRAHGVGILDVDASQLTLATVNRYLQLKSRGAL